MTSRTDELERLARLRRSGALTEAEFEAEKRRVLAADTAAEQGAQASGAPAWLPYALIGGACLIVAVVLGLWLGRAASGGSSTTSQGLTDANVAAPQNFAEADQNLIAPPPAADVRTLSPDEQLSRAFQAAFGSAGNASVQVAGRTVVYHPGKLIWLGERAVLLSPGVSTDTCHACAGALAVHYLKAVADGFQPTGSWLDAVAGPGFGAAPKWKLTSAFTAAPAIMEQSQSSGQGCSVTAATITELTPAGPVQSGPIRLAWSDSGAPAGDDANNPITGRIANIQKDGSFDVVYSAAVPFTETWIKQGSRFILQGGATKVPSC